MKTIVKKNEYNYGIEIVELKIPEDHIHMAIRIISKQCNGYTLLVFDTRRGRFFITQTKKPALEHYAEQVNDHDINVLLSAGSDSKSIEKP
jgi:REP element-mobilizing transposase RayT